MNLFVNPLFPVADVWRDHFLISTNATLFDLDVIYGYLSHESYWASGRSREAIAHSMQHSFCVGMYLVDDDGGENGRFSQIGFCRLCTDFNFHAYLCDVFILPSHRGSGLGKWLIRTIQQLPPLQNIRTWQLDTRDAQGLYAQFGFTQLSTPEKHMVWRSET